MDLRIGKFSLILLILLITVACLVCCSLLPFDNDLILGKIRGSDLKSNFLEKSTYTCAKNGNLCDNIVSTQYYYIVVDSYTAFYSWNNITVIERLPNVYARDLLKDFIVSGGWSK